MTNQLAHQPRTKTALRLSLYPALIIPVMLAAAPFARGAADLSSADIWYDPSPEAVLITYHEIFPELAEPDSIPRLRIFGDGRVLIHYSPLLRRAGDYELRLSSTELEELLLSLVDNGLGDFDQDAVVQEKVDVNEQRAQEALARDESPTLFYVADAPISQLEFRLSGYRARRSATAVGETHQTIKWRGLRTDAEMYPEIERIQRLRAAELTLQSLLAREELRSIR